MDGLRSSDLILDGLEPGVMDEEILNSCLQTKFLECLFREAMHMTAVTFDFGDNPCKTCPMENNCCVNLKNLKLTRAEYELHFAKYRDKLKVTIDKPEWLEISTQAGEPCPHWHGHCTVYETRPLECGLYPHTTTEIWATEDEVTIMYHNRTSCPVVKQISATDEAARATLKQFAEQAFGRDKKINLVEDKGLARLQAMPHKISRRLKRALT